MSFTINERRELEAIKARATSVPGTCRVRAWSVGLSFADGMWMLSMKLLDPTRSTEQDWGDLGRIAAFLGAPAEPVTPVERWVPGSSVYWMWR